MRGMGTTLVALLIAGQRGFIAHVGDSRAYLVRDSDSLQLTRDHSVLEELVQRGEITAEIAKTTYAPFRHALSRAVGVCEDVEVDTMDFEVLPGDVFLLASDGLTQYLQDGELAPLSDSTLEEATAELIGMANERGGSDNITALAVRVEPDLSDPVGDAVRTSEFATKIAAFRGLPIFRHLEYGELIRVLSATDVAAFAAGDVVLREGEQGEAMYVVLSGVVALEKDGERIAEFSTGAHFGEVSLIDKAPRSATATVVEDARLLRLVRDDLYALVQGDPQIAVKLLWSFTQTLGERLRSTNDSYADLRAVVGSTVLGES
jgi:hypothetical protein